MDGVLIVDKPSGWTSHDVVAKVRNITRIKKVGHTGTLDPFATGVLPLTLGKATRLTNYLLNSNKAYRGVIRFGYATTTFDVEGDPVGPELSPELERQRVEEIFRNYVGEVQQTVPLYSAKKIRGKPMYAYARKGVVLDTTSKKVMIHSIDLVGIEGAEVEFELRCAAGTYARSLAHDVGRDYGCGAHLLRLRRIQSGEFPLEKAISLSDGTDFHSREYLLEKAIPMRELLSELPAVVLSDADRARVVHGMDLSLLTSAWEAPEYRLLAESGDLVALARRLQSFMSPVAQPVRWVRVHPHIILQDPL